GGMSRGGEARCRSTRLADRFAFWIDLQAGEAGDSGTAISLRAAARGRALVTTRRSMRTGFGRPFLLSAFAAALLVVGGDAQAQREFRVYQSFEGYDGHASLPPDYDVP